LAVNLDFDCMAERLQKILSQWGLASRRRAEELILDGRVLLNGAVAVLGQKADPDVDRIEVDGRLIRPAARPEQLYLLLNKPLGVLSTCDDPAGRRTVLEILPEYLRHEQGLHPVGRLDADSTGALVLTNDGDLTFQITHPRHHVPKTYEVWVEGSPSFSVLSEWRQGIILDKHKTLPAKVKVLRQQPTKTLLEIVLVEGRNRQIRRVAEELGHPVLRLHRVAIGTIRLQSLEHASLPIGAFRNLSSIEVDYLKSRFGLTSVRAVAHPKEKRI
jgi:pseudouridine synthase